jgi:hypothetical protein
VSLSAASIVAKGLGSFRKKQPRRLSSLLLWQLPKAHTWPAAVLVDELNTTLL